MKRHGSIGIFEVRRLESCKLSRTAVFGVEGYLGQLGHEVQLEGIASGVHYYFISCHGEKMGGGNLVISR